MTDRELLELAAKAAGIDWHPIYSSNKVGLWVGEYYSGREWNPLTDDGDALRLAVKLGITVALSLDGKKAEASHRSLPWTFYNSMENEDATRRAITRAAAAIGEAMK